MFFIRNLVLYLMSYTIVPKIYAILVLQTHIFDIAKNIVLLVSIEYIVLYRDVLNSTSQIKAM